MFNPEERYAVEIINIICVVIVTSIYSSDSKENTAIKEYIINQIITDSENEYDKETVKTLQHYDSIKLY